MKRGEEKDRPLKIICPEGFKTPRITMLFTLKSYLPQLIKLKINQNQILQSPQRFLKALDLQFMRIIQEAHNMYFVNFMNLLLDNALADIMIIK